MPLAFEQGLLQLKKCRLNWVLWSHSNTDEYFCVSHLWGRPVENVQIGSDLLTFFQGRSERCGHSSEGGLTLPQVRAPACRMLMPLTARVMIVDLARPIHTRRISNYSRD